MSPDAIGALTTIDLEFQLTGAPTSGIFAVVWLKTSRKIVVGLSLPEDYQSPHLDAAARGMKVQGDQSVLQCETPRAGSVPASQWGIEGLPVHVYPCWVNHMKPEQECDYSASNFSTTKKLSVMDLIAV